MLKLVEEETSNGKVVFPPLNQIFKAFEICKVEEIRVVILGQDPYHNEGQAMGLSFSVPKGIGQRKESFC